LSLISVLIPAIFILFVLGFFSLYLPMLKKQPKSLYTYTDAEAEPEILPLDIVDRGDRIWPRQRTPMSRLDWVLVLGLSVLYAIVAFTGLGDNVAPQTFCQFEEEGRYVQIELKEETQIEGLRYYTGLYSGEYRLQFSTDGETWVDQTSMTQEHGDLFKWMDAELLAMGQTVKYIRIIANTKMELGEVALYGYDEELIPTDQLIYDEGAAPLFDEQDTVPDAPDYLNSAYFDEIYHARTAYENVRNIYPYEVSHPPLGKLIISLGIQMFGMTPFGWRFMGTLFGVLMLSILYVLIKNLFGSTTISVCGTLIFAFDFMHFVQTRIATIDTYSVFFILLMYLFMYRFISEDPDDPLRPRWRRLLPLALCGISFGLGCASKWTCIYAGAGLAVIWALYWFFRGRELCALGRRGQFVRAFFKNCLFCLVFFVLIPAIIYYCSYYPYGKASGMDGISMYFKKEYLDIVVENQKFMYTYHAGVDATHPYSSRWYQWLIDGRPILYYLNYFDDGTKSAFGATLSPLLCWGGLLAILSMLYLSIAKRDKKALFILIGYLAQLLPWVLVSRITFAYHYFPSSVFLVLALCHVFDTIRQKDLHWQRYVYTYTGLCLLLFVMFYPVLSGIRVSTDYTTTFLRWFPSWPF
jgi:dolichyl-phosphate-mannose-protein mannosyltransferase